MDTCICMIESLCCPSETITILFISSDIKLKVFFLIYRKNLGEKNQNKTVEKKFHVYLFLWLI